MKTLSTTHYLDEEKPVKKERKTVNAFLPRTQCLSELEEAYVEIGDRDIPTKESIIHLALQEINRWTRPHHA